MRKAISLAVVLGLVTGQTQAARHVPDASTSQSWLFEFTPAQPIASLQDYLNFVQVNSQGIEGLRSQYMVGELLMENGDYDTASKIFQNLAAVALDEEFFNVSVLQRLADCYLHLGLFPQASETYALVRKSGVKALVPEALLGQAISALGQGQKEQALLYYQELISFYPPYKTQQRLTLMMGLILWENQKHEDALEAFMRDEKNPACLYFAGLSQRALNKSVEALGLFKRVIKDHPTSAWAPRARFETGETFYLQKDYPLANRTFGEIQKDSPDPLWQNLALYRLACADLQVEQDKAAVDKLFPLKNKKLTTPNHTDTTYLLTEALVRVDKMSQVNDMLKKEFEGKTPTPETQYRYLWSLTAVGNYPESIKRSRDLLSVTWDQEITPKTLLVQGYAYEKLGQTPESLASYQLVVDNFPTSPYAARALHLTGMAFFRSKQYVPIITQVQNHWNVLPASIRKKYPETFFWIAEGFLALERGKNARDNYQQFLDTAPSDHPLMSQALMGKAMSYVVEKDFDTAIATLQRSIQTAAEKDDKPQINTLTLDMANVQFNAKNYEAAAAAYRQFQTLDPKSPQLAFSHYYEGLALYRAQYYNDAVVAWEKMLKAAPKDPLAPEALFKTAKTKFDLGQYPEAVKDYEKLIKSYSKNEFVKDARLQIGQSYYNAGNFTSAIAAYTSFLKFYPADELSPQVVQLLQTSYYQAKKSPEEIEKLTAHQPKSAVLGDIYWEEGAKQYNEKNYDKALAYFQKILFEFPSSTLAAQSAFYRAECLYLLEKHKEASLAYDNFLQFYPENDQRSLAMFHRAISLFNEKDYEESARGFYRFATQYPQDPLAKNAVQNVALSHAKAGNNELAVKAYREYARLYPSAEDAGATYLQMGLLQEKAGQFNAAAQAYRATPPQLAEYPEALLSAGRCYRSANNAPGEKQVYEMLFQHPVKNDPFRVAAVLQLGEIYLLENDAARASTALNDVIQNGDEASAGAARDRLNALQPAAKPAPASGKGQ